MRGGKRVGAGRKQGFAAKSAEEARKIFAERVAQEIRPLTEILLRRAKAGDIRAIRELFDRAWGKAPQMASVDLHHNGLPRPILSFDSSFRGHDEVGEKKTAVS